MTFAMDFVVFGAIAMSEIDVVDVKDVLLVESSRGGPVLRARVVYDLPGPCDVIPRPCSRATGASRYADLSQPDGDSPAPEWMELLRRRGATISRYN